MTEPEYPGEDIIAQIVGDPPLALPESVEVQEEEEVEVEAAPVSGKRGGKV